MKEVWAYEEKDPPTHLTQLGYNAVGLDMAKHLYNYIYGTSEKTEVAVYVADTTSHTLVVDEITISSKASTQLVITPTSGNANDLTIEVTRNLKLDDQLRVSAVAGGKGTITVKQGDTVIKTITVNVE